MAEIVRKTKRYPTDVTHEERQQIQPMLPDVLRRGRKPRPTCAKCSTRPLHRAQWRWLVDAADPLQAIANLCTGGISAKLTGQTVYWQFRRFVRLLLFRTIHDVALMLDRERAGREVNQSGGILDSQ